MDTGKRVLWVEGRDDEHVVKSICGWLGLGKIDHIESQEGKDPLLETLPIKLKESDLMVLGIILDADTDLHARWRALADRLRAAGYGAIGEWPDPQGTVLCPPQGSLLPRLGIWLMPDTRFEPLKRPKVLMHTWLAWQEEPGKPYGQAITARYLDATLPTGAAFAAWLQRVFFQEPA